MTASSQPRIAIEDLPSLEMLSDEEKARIFGAGRARLGLEALETRELLAASITAVLTGSTLRIEGTDNPDRIVLQRDGSNLRVQGVTITNQAGAPVTAPLAGVNAIRIDGLGGSDLFWIQHNLAESFDLRGGAAADLIVAGSQSRITTERDATDRRISPDVVTVWKQLEALTPNANGQYSLSSIKVGSFSLTNATATVSASGVTLSGDVMLAALGTVRLTGTVTPDNTFQASFPERTLLGGLAAVKNTTVTLSGDRATITADLIITKLNVATRLTGWVKADGTSLLEATATFKVAGFQVTGGKWTLRDKLEVNFTLPMPALGNSNVTFRGSYGATGWSIEGKVPVNIQIGVVTLKQITVGVTKDQTGDQLILGAKGTIASIDGFVDATATARLYTDGRCSAFPAPGWTTSPMP